MPYRIISGHGAFHEYRRDTEGPKDVTVPNGCEIRFYCKHGETMLVETGDAIEKAISNNTSLPEKQYVERVTSGTVPNYHLLFLFYLTNVKDGKQWMEKAAKNSGKPNYIAPPNAERYSTLERIFAVAPPGTVFHWVCCREVVKDTLSLTNLMEPMDL
jgi:hypothetical protein